MSLVTKLALATLALTALALPLQNAGAAGVVHTINVFNFGFSDQDTGQPVTVAAVGDLVQFVWTSGTHTATNGLSGQSLGAFDSGNLGPGATFTVSLNAPGVVTYTCKIHSSMNGLIVVQP